MAELPRMSSRHVAVGAMTRPLLGYLRVTLSTALVNALKIGESRHLAIPALHHLAHFPGAQLAMKELL